MIYITSSEHSMQIALTVVQALFGYFAIASTIGCLTGLVLHFKDVDGARASPFFHAMTIAFGLGGVLLSMFVAAGLYRDGGTVSDWLVTATALCASLWAMFFSRSWFDVENVGWR